MSALLHTSVRSRLLQGERNPARPRPGGRFGQGLLLAGLIVLPSLAGAQTFNWVAFNDHRPTAPPGASGWVTAPNVTTYDLFNTPSGGPLTDLDAGTQLAVGVSVTRSGSGVRDLGTTERPFAGTPAYELFHGIADPGGSGVVGLEANGWMLITFTNLNPAKRYSFYGTVMRGGNYLDRWGVCTISNVVACSPAHTGLGGTNVITQASFPASTLGPDQVAWCGGENRAAGDVIGWDDIEPNPEGSFSILSQMYRGPVPSGRNTTAPSYSYALSVFALAEFEVEPTPLTLVLQPATETIVVELLPFSLSVAVEGGSPRYQWYKEGVGPLPGATGRTYDRPTASLGDAGDYCVVVTNSLGAVTSSVATVTVWADTSPPKLVRVRPRFNAFQLQLSLSEPVTIESAENLLNYSIAGTHPVQASLQGNGTVILLTLPAPLPFDSTSTLSLSQLTDRAALGNRMLPTDVPVRAPTLSSGFLRADYYTGITWHTVSALTGNAKYPDLYDQTFYRTNSTALTAFGDNYGLRLWGFFVPPTNGNYTFYVRSDDESEVFLSSDADPAHKLLVASQTGSGRPYDDANGSPRFSTMPGLVAGQRYFFEALLKEGGGEDYLTVVCKAEGEPAPVHNTPSVTPIPSAWLACYADAQDVALDLTTQPASTNILERQTATFAVAAGVAPTELASCLLYQWQRADRVGTYSDLPGARTARYTTPPLTAADDGARFVCVVTVPGATLRSDPATVTVSTFAPRISRVTLAPGGTNLTFTLSTRNGVTYVLEYTDTLTPPLWQRGNTLVGLGGDLTLSVPLTTAPRRFFRLKLE